MAGVGGVGRMKITFQRVAGSSDLTKGDNRNFSIVSFGGFCISVWSSDPEGLWASCQCLSVSSLKYVCAARRTYVLPVGVTETYPSILLAELAMFLVRILSHS